MWRDKGDASNRWVAAASHDEVSQAGGYRFSQPKEPAAVVLPRTYRLNHHKQPPEELNTIGDHLRRRRLVLKLLQRQVADQIGVDKASIYNWEGNRSVSFRQACMKYSVDNC